MNRLLIEIAAALLLIGGFALYERHAGAAQCVQADRLSVARQEAANAAQAADDHKIINIEANTYAQALAAAPEPTPALICVRKYAAPRPLPEAAPAGPVSHDAPDVPTATDQSFDPGPGVTKIGKTADAQVIELQGYIRDICLAR